VGVSLVHHRFVAILSDLAALLADVAALAALLVADDPPILDDDEPGDPVLWKVHDFGFLNLFNIF
jgi:hypothetical protein